MLTINLFFLDLVEQKVYIYISYSKWDNYLTQILCLTMKKILSTNNCIEGYEPRFQGFYDLMPHQIREILLVSSLYDSFILEEDGQLSEHVFSDYFDLNLSYAPRISRVSTGENALEAINKRSFDLIITMMRLSDMDVNTFGKRIKSVRPDLPIILLAYESDIRAYALKTSTFSNIDKVFVWTGDTKILLAITKLMEDRLNVSYDIQVGDVRVIIVIENSRYYYSLFLPLIYSEIMKQTQALIAEGLNEMHRQLRRRARPKILLATTFEEGMELYQKYQRNILGIISDIRYSREGKIDPEAGFKFAQQIKEKDPDMPLLLMSTQQQNAAKANKIGASFLDKNSRSLLNDLREFILNHLGFGDFVFRLPNSREVGRASTMREMQEMLTRVPDESIEYHASRNHFSNWLMARTEFTLAKKMRPRKISDFANIQELRLYLVHSITDLRESKQRGVIIEFSRQRFDPESDFVRLSTGSLGGKARGIAFIRSLLDQSQVGQRFPDVKIIVPKTAVIGTDVFDQFLDDNQLRHTAIQSANDEEIARIFLKKHLPRQIMADLKFFLEQVHYPLAVRSSSLLEDSQYQPFAGLYATYMLPNNAPDIKTRLSQLSDAIKLVYASTFYQSPKAYIETVSRTIEEEKMAVIIQELVGQRFEHSFYPSFSGVAQSYNFYPVSYVKPEDGIAQVALGLGKIIVDGGQVLRFSPRHPKILPQFASPKQILKNSQREFYALNMSDPAIKLTKNDDVTLFKFDLAQAERDGMLAPLGGVYSINDQIIYDGIHHEGPRVVSFSHILKSELFPLSAILSELLEIGRHGIGSPIQIEFAVNLKSPVQQQSEFYFLQIRPMLGGSQHIEVTINDFESDAILLQTSNALGNGVIADIHDIIYVKPQNFNAAQTIRIAADIGKINHELVNSKRYYLLIGPGRWGTADRWLGIPVTWDQISNVKTIIETDLDGFVVEPSQGTHFFHNIASFQIGYFCIRGNKKGEHVDWDWLDQQPAKNETEYLRHIHLSKPIEIKIDGRSRKGVILKSKN